jgi:hypothetical protein
VALPLLRQVCMPSGTEIYGGYTVHWDIISSPDAQGWNAKVGIVSPPDRSGFCEIISITGPRFESESEAREYVVHEAKKRVDEIIDRRRRSSTKEEIEQWMNELARAYERTLPGEPRRDEIANELSVLCLRLDRLL